MQTVDDDYVSVPTLPCVVCGAAVFQLTKTRRLYCSGSCRYSAWKDRHPNHRSRTQSPVERSTTITVLYANNGRRSFVGYGPIKGSAHAHAQAQARRLGSFTEIGHTTVSKILRDLERHAEP